MMTPIDQLTRISEVLLKDEIDFPELTEAIAAYKKLLLEISEIDLEASENRKDIHFSNGKALGTTWAVYCIDDIIRTKRFVRGLHKAIEHLKKSRPKPIHILYAGCGPFATLALPIMVKYSEQDVRFTLIDINDQSIKMVKIVLSCFGLDRFLQEVVQEDLTQYIIPDSSNVDIILSETMQRSLEREQQVPIMFNLASQVGEHTLLIPEKIELSLGLIRMDIQKLQESYNYFHNQTKLLKIFELSKEEIVKQQRPGLDLSAMVFPEKTMHIPRTMLDRYQQLAVFTDIQVFGEEKIGFNESGLTFPLILESLAHMVNHEIQVKIRYKVDKDPGIQYDISPLYKY